MNPTALWFSAGRWLELRNWKVGLAPPKDNFVGAASMKGHIRERSAGSWAIVLDVNDPETGKRRRKWHSFKGTKREAQKECARLVAEMTTGAYVEPHKTTLAGFLDRW